LWLVLLEQKSKIDIIRLEQVAVGLLMKLRLLHRYTQRKGAKCAFQKLKNTAKTRGE
jgi:hypothetical protein